MTIHSFFIFDRHCNCIYNREYSHEANDNGTINKNNQSDGAKLLFGMLYSLKNMASKLGDGDMNNLLKSFSTSKYRTHFLESATGLKFVLISDTSIDNLQNVLWELYSNYYVKNIAFNSLSAVDFKEDEKISNSNFIVETDKFLQSLAVFQ